MQAERTTTDKMAALYVTERLRGDALGGLNDALYEAARAVLLNWQSGDLAEAVRLVQGAIDQVDNHHDEVAAINAGWERRDNAWIRFTHAGETLDADLPQSGIWIADGMIHALRAEHALEQDAYRTLIAGRH